MSRIKAETLPDDIATYPDKFCPTIKAGLLNYLSCLINLGRSYHYAVRFNNASFLGGNEDDQGNALARDSEDLIYVTGHTLSTQGFPTTPGAYDNTSGSSSVGTPVGDAFLCKLDISVPYLVNDTTNRTATTGETCTFNITVGDNIGVKEVADARRFGVRRHTTPTVITGSSLGETQLLTRFAYSELARLNAYAFAGTISLEQRPDLWPGRSVYLVERQKLAYITRVTNEFRTKQAHRTTLTLSYVHHPMQRIGIPWWEASQKQTSAPAIEAILG